MSGYDALDELYERLRGQEDAQRAGGITPETIRAARGGVADGYGRELHVVDENAADGDSVPLAGISRDSRERIEADAWEAARLDMSRTWEERRDAIVALLDRQAALTEREICKWWRDEEVKHDERIHRISELQSKVDELRAELATAEADNEYLRDELAELRPPRTVEDVLADFAAEVEQDRNTIETARKYAAEIRELMGVDA